MQLLPFMMLLAMWLISTQPLCLAHAWPRFLTIGSNRAALRSDSTHASPNTDALSPPPFLFAGAADRLEQARALWQEVEAKGRLSPCWKRSLLLLHAKCAEVQRDDAMRSRLSLFMATCDADSDGRTHPNFHCGADAVTATVGNIRGCVQSLTDTAYAAFLQYRLHADVLCAYLQEEVYQERTEAAVMTMQKQMEDSIAVLSALQRSGTAMAAQAAHTQALQQEAQEATTALRQQLLDLQGGHAATLISLRDAAADVLRTSERTDATLTQLHAHVQSAAAEALESVQALSRQSLQQFAALEEQSRSVLHLMDQVDHVQRLLARQSFSKRQLLRLLCGVAAVFMAMFIPRTSAARLPAVVLTLLATTGLPLLRWWTEQERWLLLSVAVWQCVCAGAALVIVCCAGLRDSSAESLQRRVAREEAAQMWHAWQHSCVVPSTRPSWVPSMPCVPPRHGAPHVGEAARSPSPRPPQLPPSRQQRYVKQPSPPVSLPLPLALDVESPENSEEEKEVLPCAPPAVTAAQQKARSPSPIAAQERSESTVELTIPLKRGRPPAVKDDEGSSCPSAKTARSESRAVARKTTPAKQRANKRSNSKPSPKKRG